MSALATLDCPRCGERFDPQELHNRCACGSPLLASYDLETVAAVVDPVAIATRAPTLWRYRELLPVSDPARIISLGEGFTPLLPLPASLGFDRLLYKDEGSNPTGTFKARGAACGVSRAAELGARHLALPTAGNAGGAWACYGAAAGLPVHVAAPADAPAVNLLECEAYGAEVSRVDGLISDAARVTAEGVSRHGWFDVATLHEPYRVEGKKTLGFEIAEQLGDGLRWRMPDAIIYPAGGGVGIIGIRRALGQALALGWAAGDLPRLMVVQAAGCAPIVRAFEEGAGTTRPWTGARTLAAGLRVPDPLGGGLVLEAIRATGGTAVAVEDTAIVDALLRLARQTGILAAPEAAATLAGADALAERGELARDEEVVLVGTGTGLKYPEVLEEVLHGGHRRG